MNASETTHDFRGTIRRQAGFSKIGRSVVLAPLLTLALTAPGSEANTWSSDETRSAIAALASFEHALARRDIRGAERAWQDAHMATLRGDWRAQLRIGDAALRLRLVTGAPQVAVARARQSYLVALFKARTARSSDGAIQVAESFAALGDRDVVEQSLRVAEQLVPPADDTAREQLRELRARLTPIPDPRATEVSLRSAPRVTEPPR